MKSAFIAAALFSSLIVALPTQNSARANEVDIVVKTGDGDSSVGGSIAVGKIVPTNPNFFQASQGVSAAVSSDASASCQAFSDAAGTVKLGGVFTTTTTVQFGKSDGGVDSVADDAVPIGAFCCVIGSDFSSCEGSSSSSTTTSSAAASTTTASSSSSSSQTVRIQLNGDDESAAQGEVPVDNSIFLLAAHPPFFTTVTSGFIEDSEGLSGVSCQAFKDMMARHPVGQPITEAGTSFKNGKDVRIVALRCTHA